MNTNNKKLNKRKYESGALKWSKNNREALGTKMCKWENQFYFA